jgi:DinB superfamily
MALDFSEIILSVEEREHDRLMMMKEQDVSTPISPGKWSRKEILGHLIDSASNNHQRFVRAQLSDRLEFPPYVQMEWVETQNYADESWRLLVDLWSAYNLHLAHVIANLPPEKLIVPCRIGERDVMTLEELIADYVRHMEHHLKQLNGVSE